MTTVRVLFLTNDSEYYHRVTSYFARYHSEIKPSFSDSLESSAGQLAKRMYDVVLIGEEFAGESIAVPSGTSGAYLTETPTGSEINGLRSFCKYRSGDALYRTVIIMFADVSNVQPSETHGFKIYAFAGANGGAGSTTIAAAFAYRQASLGKKTLYFCCDAFADYSGFLYDGSEGGSLSDMIFIVKSGSGAKGASLKAAALLKKDVSGVKFMESCKEPYDFEVLTAEHIEEMLDIILGADDFNSVVIDGSIYDERYRKLVTKKADTLFIVVESDKNAQAKLSRLVRFLSAADKRDNTDLVSRSVLVSNKDSGNNPANIEEINCCGSVPRYKDTNIRNIASAAARLDIWENVCL